MRFSERTAWELGENEFARAVREARAAGRVLVDLTVSNPTACGFGYDAAALLAPLSDARAMLYEPDALGMVRGREAVARYYAELGAGQNSRSPSRMTERKASAKASASAEAEASVKAGAEASVVLVPVERICLTTSTSEAYSFLFRLLCDVGDEVLIARPSYPLFEFIARLDDVRLVEYPLLYDPVSAQGWHLDFHALEAAVTERTRAVVVVHPNNPTGNFASEMERAALEEMCARRGLALIVDEVFLDYAMEGVEARSFAAGPSRALTFVLSGLSKVCGLPQMKVSWIAACGPEELVREAMARLEVVADTFLSVNAPMQFALGEWLDGREAMQREIRGRVAENLRVLDERLRGTMVSRLAVQGGWAVVLRVPRGRFVEEALERGVMVQPGEFYGLPEGRIVLSLLTPVEEWVRGLERMLVGE